LMNFFMVDGSPDPELFRRGVKALIDRARRHESTGRKQEIRLFGEMVSLLWPANYVAAERLEALWNEVIAEYSIPLLCGYSMGGPGQGQLPESLMKVHSHAISWRVTALAALGGPQWSPG
jgi:hypothetical protein